MDHRKRNGITPSQFGESRFLSSFSQSKFEEPTPKKPKLDIAINGNHTKDCVSKTVENKKSNVDDMWADDEFDFEAIMAQVEHDESLALSQIPLTQSTNIEINRKVIPNACKINQQTFNMRTEEVKNSPRVPLRRIGSSQWPSSSNSSSNTSNALKNVKVPGNAAFLHADLEQLRLENKRIKEELNKRAGEARILRDKVNSFEKEKEKIKKECSSKMDTFKAEAERNNSSLLKEIKSLRGQLDVKNMELKTAERRTQMSSSVNRIQPDSPCRPGTSARVLQKDRLGDFELDRSLMKAKTLDFPLKFIRESVIPDLLKSSHPEAPVSESACVSNPRLFSGLTSTDGGNTSVSRSRCPTAKSDLLSPHTSITPCATLLLSPGLVDITSDSAQQTISQVVDICQQILTELLKQLESVVCSNNRLIERERELLLSGSKQLPLDRDYNLVSHRELYIDERGIPARRALGLMSLLVQASDYAAKKILSSSLKELPEILDTLHNIVQQIEKQRRTLMFQGVLAGSMTLIRSLLRVEVNIPEVVQSLLIDILRWTVYARPGSLVIRNILQTLLAAARYPYIINSLCRNSGEKSFKENPRHSMIQFTPDSCILQVLCSLLKTADTPRKHILTDLVTLWVLSLFCGRQPRPPWLSAAPNTKSCRCHSLLNNLCFSLLSEACFSYSSAAGEDGRMLKKLLERGVPLVNTFMNDDEHLLAIVDPYSLGCYEHFLHFMSDAKIRLDVNTREILGFLCTQEEVLKQSGNSTSNELQSSQLYTALGSFEVGENEKRCPRVLDMLETM